MNGSTSTVLATALIVFPIVLWFAWAFTVAKIAQGKGYPFGQWFGWGLLCGIFALLVIMAWPVRTAPPAQPDWSAAEESRSL
jgi:hypothetical protein